MIFLHFNNLETFFGGLAYQRYLPMLIQYFRKRNAKFMSYSEFPGFDKINEDIVMTGREDLNYDTLIEGVKFLNEYKLNNYKFKLYYLASDIWPRYDSIFTNAQETIIKATNYKLIHVMMDTDHLAYLWSYRFNLKNYLHNFINFQYNYYYDGIIVDLNPNPINKILLSGNSAPSLYPERHYLKSLNLPEITVLPFIQFSDYTNTLNKYLCAIVTGVASIDPATGQSVSAKCLLLKYLEVLGSGALLLVDDSIEKELESLGLKHKDNCYVSSLSNIKETVQYITNMANRDEINRIRLNGQNFYKDYKLRQDEKIHDIFKDLV
jgi:hypothetical protein